MEYIFHLTVTEDFNDEYEYKLKTLDYGLLSY